MIEVNKKNLPRCWRYVKSHPDIVRLIPGVEKTENCLYRVKSGIKWPDNTSVEFYCSNPRALVEEQQYGVTSLTASVDPATFCEPYDLYRRGRGDKSLLIIDLKAIPVRKMITDGETDKT